MQKQISALAETSSLFNLMMSVMEAYIKSNSNISAKLHHPRAIVSDFLSQPGGAECCEVWQTCNFEVIEMTGLLAVVRARKRVRGAANESVSWVAPACQPASRTQET